jgi:Ankyrin repeats (3 copies)
MILSESTAGPEDTGKPRLLNSSLDETETEATDDDSDRSEYTEDVDLDDDLDDIQLEMLDFERKMRRRSASRRFSSGKRRASDPGNSPAIRALQTQTPQRASMPLVSMALLQERIDAANANNSYYFQAPQTETIVDTNNANNKRPEDYLTHVILDGVPISFLRDEEFFEPVTLERIAAHSIVVTSAIRAGNLEALQELHQDGIPLGGCNPQGESMIHLACRLNQVDVVQFLIHTALVPVQVCDDSGRTPLHDAAWTTKPNFDLIRLLLQESPELFFIQDKRQFSPLRYVPQSAWPAWRDFLQQEAQWLKRIVTETSAQKANHVLDGAQERMQNLIKRMSVS